jgi:hypothetical protein
MVALLAMPLETGEPVAWHAQPMSRLTSRVKCRTQLFFPPLMFVFSLKYGAGNKKFNEI